MTMTPDCFKTNMPHTCHCSSKRSYPCLTGRLKMGLTKDAPRHNLKSL